MLIMFILGWLTVALVVGAFLLIAVGLWVLVDLFLIPGIVESHKKQVRAQVGQELSVIGNDTPSI